MFWNAITAIASTVSMVAFVLTAVYIREELKGLEKDRYLSITSELFTVWQSREFMEAQLWLIHRLEQTTWREFVAAHRCDVGEVAFHRVGSFYDRLGTLVRLGFVNEREILSTTGGYAIAVWGKIEPWCASAADRELDPVRRIREAPPRVSRVLRTHPGRATLTVIPFSVEQPVVKTSLDELKRRLDRAMLSRSWTCVAPLRLSTPR